MKKIKLKRMLSLILAMSIMLTTLNGISFPVTAAEASSGTDENGFSWTSDGTSVTITGYNPSKDSSLFYGIQYNGHYYGLSINTKTWTEAKADCEANGGHLVTIADEAEQKIVQDLFSYDSSTTAWIGATDETTEGEWGWCTGEEFSYTNWNSGEPNNDNEEDYAGIYVDNFKWNDWGSSQTLKYICEWEELPPEDIFSEYKFYGLEYNGHYYGLSQNKLSWEDAKVSCEEVGGKLVSINTEDEQTLVERLLGFAPSGNRWIGAYKADGLWQWVDGEVLGYTNWDPGEPNGNADTAHIYYSNHRWDDASGTMYYICEWTEEPSEDYFKICLSNIVIPEKINDLPVTVIGSSAFANKTTISSVVIPDTVTTISSSAFSGCSSLESVVLPNGVTTIDSYAFSGCTNLTDITMPESLTTIGSYAFSDCTGITELTLPANLTTINEYAFSNCTGLTQLDISEGLTTIYSYAFNNCTGLVSVDFPASVTTIASRAFFNCSNITEIQYPVSWNSTPRYKYSYGTSYFASPFEGCTSLTSISIPEGVVAIPSYAFNNFTALTDITLPDTLTTIGSYAFSGATGITKLVLPNGVTTIDSYAFSGCTGLLELSISDSIRSIGSYAFSNCSSLGSVTIEENGEIKVVEYNNHYYAVFNTFKTWEEAKQVCEAFGGHLVTITDADEQTFVTELVNKSGKVCWLGASDTEEEGVWKWVTGEDFTYSNWKSGEPNNSNGTENYAGVYLSNNSYKWNDFTVGSTTVGGFICEWDSAEEMAGITPEAMTTNDGCVNSLKSIANYAFNGCSSLKNVYYSNTEEIWNTISIGTNNDALINATYHFAHTHIFGEWEVDYEPTCAKEGKKHKTCVDCGYSMYEAIEMVAHTYELEVVPPTYLEQGYTLYTCSVCGDTYKDTYVDPLDRIDLSNATLELEYTSAYYEGLALAPDVTLTYEGETFDSSKELKITYTNNNQVGTATVTIEGINRFEGTVELQFEISYEVIPEQIVNVIAIGEIGKVSLSWGESSEVNTDSYNIYRKADGETEYQLIKTINGRTVLSYEDKNVEKSKTYSYYVFHHLQTANRQR